MQKLNVQIVRGACIKANPEKDFVIWACEGCQTVYGEYVNGCPKCWDTGLHLGQNLKKYQNRSVTARECPIRLADVLLALAFTTKAGNIAISRQGFFFDFTKPNDLMFSEWNLRKDDLLEQSPDCLEFLANLLKDEVPVQTNS